MCLGIAHSHVYAVHLFHVALLVPVFGFAVDATRDEH